MSVFDSQSANCSISCRSTSTKILDLPQPPAKTLILEFTPTSVAPTDQGKQDAANVTEVPPISDGYPAFHAPLVHDANIVTTDSATSDDNPGNSSAPVDTNLPISNEDAPLQDKNEVVSPPIDDNFQYLDDIVDDQDVDSIHVNEVNFPDLESGNSTDKDSVVF